MLRGGLNSGPPRLLAQLGEQNGAYQNDAEAYPRAGNGRDPPGVFGVDRVTAVDGSVFGGGRGRCCVQVVAEAGGTRGPVRVFSACGNHGKVEVEVEVSEGANTT